MKIREKYLRVAEAAEYLGIAPNTLRAWGAAGKIPEYRHPLNNYRLYKPEHLERLFDEIEESMTIESPPGKKRRRAK